MISKYLVTLFLSALAAGHSPNDAQKAMCGPHESLWFNTLPGDGTLRFVQYSILEARELSLLRQTPYFLAYRHLAASHTSRV